MLRWLKTVVVSDEEKALIEASGRDREGERKRIVADVSKSQQVTSKPGSENSFGMSPAGVRFLAGWCPACRRREPGLPRPCGTGESAPRYCRSAVVGQARGSVSKRGDRERREYRRGARWRTGS